MPGYDCDVIMAAGAFISGSSIELSADGPLRPPYQAFLQGGLNFDTIRLACLLALQRMTDAGQAAGGRGGRRMNSRQQPPGGRPPRGEPARRDDQASQGDPSRHRPGTRPELAGVAMPSAHKASAERLRRIERRKARTRAVWLSVFVLLIMFLTVVMIITVMQRTPAQTALPVHPAR